MDALRALGCDLTVVADSHQPSVVRAMVRLGMGWARSRAPEDAMPTASWRDRSSSDDTSRSCDANDHHLTRLPRSSPNGSSPSVP